jgi:quercetin dioxygenase-like cupin family protein
MYYDRPITNQGDIGSFAGGASDEPHPGVTRRSVTSDRATVTSYAFTPGATFPIHRHEQEQVTIVQSGTVEMTVDGAVHALEPGGWSIVPPEVEHGITAGPAGAEILAIIVPPRSDPDAYTLASEGTAS